MGQDHQSKEIYFFTLEGLNTKADPESMRWTSSKLEMSLLSMSNPGNSGLRRTAYPSCWNEWNVSWPALSLDRAERVEECGYGSKSLCHRRGAPRHL